MVSVSNLLAKGIIMGIFRHPKTQNERWQYEMSIVNEDEIEVKIRGARRSKYMPTAWDDIMHFGNNRNWKQYRRSQHRKRRAG